MARRTVLLLVAVLIATLGTAMVFMYVRGIEARVQEGQDPVKVIVATEHIAAGESITEAQAAGKIDQKVLRYADVPEGAIGTIEPLAGLVALDNIYPGEPLLPQNFGDPGAGAALPIPTGSIAVSVELADPHRVAGFVHAGSEVAVFVSADPVAVEATGKRELASRTALLLERAPVLAIGDTTLRQRTTTDDGEQTQEEIPHTIVTLAVDQASAEKLIYGDRNGELTMGLLNDDSVVRIDEGVTVTDIFPGAF